MFWLKGEWREYNRFIELLIKGNEETVVDYTYVLYRGYSKGVSKMKQLKTLARLSAILVFLICLYSFLLGNSVFEGRFMNDSAAWYFLAKGIFCSFTLYLLELILEALQNRNKVG